ncbi:FxDxF family PEP-CTERM protein [Duganella sp. S19_KUP01_CR8]|uniref:FxDxF family PEP-CTERM protein n=1 Tax=Duganella sp. S19_KUP01_CR8 TaxID=3025502 RepID=UPI002FCDCAC2
MKFSKIVIAACAFVAAIGTASTAFAATETIVLGQSNVAGFASQDMAHLTITESGANTVWTLSADWNNALNATNPFIFGLQFTDAKNAAPVGFSATSGSISLANNGLSATQVKFRTANNSGRFTDGEAATWTFNNTKLSDFSAFQLHINALTATGGSVKFTQLSAVPEPETYGMLLAGLGLVGFAARRRAAK